LYLLKTNTASTGLLPDISYTIPLIVFICPFAEEKKKIESKKNNGEICFMNGCKSKQFPPLFFVKK
jgi:hypothetical protein